MKQDSKGSSDPTETFFPLFHLVQSVNLPSSHTPGRVTPHSNVSNSLLRYHVKFIHTKIEIFFLLHAAKVRSSCEEGPGRNALQSAYHNPKLDVTDLKQTEHQNSFRPKIANKQIKTKNELNRRRRWQKSVGPKLVQGENRKERVANRKLCR